MRSLKFRVWSEEDREYRTDCNLTRLFNSVTGTPATIYSDEGDRFDIEQYTGLKDKNGKEIYEGDILKFIKDPEMARVVWNIPSAEFHIKWLECGVSDSLSWHLHDHGGAEVIGNIHENGDLLK